MKDTKYEIYKNIRDSETYFKSWGTDAERLTKNLKEGIYAKYLVKSRVLQRDNFTCQNIDPKVKCHSKELTIHHFKHKRNGGKDIERNLITICKSCHNRFNKAKSPLIFSNENNLPPHIRGHTQMLHIKDKEVNWKHLKSEMKSFRKTLKYEGIKFKELDWKMIVKLMEWLAIPYDEYSEV